MSLPGVVTVRLLAGASLLRNMCAYAIIWNGSMWLYTGRETYLDTHPDMVGDLKSVLRFSHYQVPGSLPPHPYAVPQSIEVWIYPTSNCCSHARLLVALMLRPIAAQTDVMTFNSLGIAPLRAVCWDESAHVIVFPPFAEFPDIHAIAKTDLRSYVSTGNNLVFLGGFASVGLINEIFGFQLKAEVYQEGPFYRSERYAPVSLLCDDPKLIRMLWRCTI
jgi:hypothetical protein